MAQYATHVCPNCGRRFKCDQPIKRTFAAESPTLNSGVSSSWPNIEYQVYWGISKITDTFWKSVAFTIPVTVASLAAARYWEWPASIPEMVFVSSFIGSLRLFGKVPEFHNAIETEQPAEPQPEPEPDDTRKFVGWETETHTKTTQHMEWYASPVPIRQARSFALALANNGFGWIDERDLSNHKANISQGNYRKLRRDWIDRGLCTETGDRKTVIRAKHTIWRIAFEPPK